MKKEEQEKEKRKREEKAGKQITCLVCKSPVGKGKKQCTRHEKVPQRQNGTQVQCKKIKSNKQKCKVMTVNKSGLCYYHD